MKDLLLIKDTTENRITYYLLAFFLAMLPFDRIYSEIALITLLIHTLIHLRPAKLDSRIFRSFWVPASIYLLTCIGTIYSSFTSHAFFDWQIQLALLLFPFIFSVSMLDIKKYTVNLLFVLGLSCVGTVIFLYGNALASIAYYHLPLSTLFSNAFFNHNFSQPIDLHATYFSMYIALSVPLFIYLWIRDGKRSHRLFYSFCLLVLFAGLLQLSSRSVLIALLIIINLVIPFLALKKKLRFRFLGVSLSLSIASILLVTHNDAFRNRFVTDLKGDLTQAIINNNVLEPRLVRWECAFELIKASPVWGHGSGSEIPLLKEIYFRRQFYNSYVNELNAHNEYLSFLVKTGLIGLCVFLWVLYKGFELALKQRNLLFCSFMVIVSVVSFSENILDANKVIFFFAVFYSMFYVGGRRTGQLFKDEIVAKNSD